MSNGMLNLNEVMQFLDMDKEHIEELIQKDKLSAYKIGGEYLRFRKDQVLKLRSVSAQKNRKKNVFVSRVHDFWDFNNFYIITGLFLIGLLYFVLR